MSDGAVKYIDRSTGTVVTESVMGDGALRFAYNTLLGRTLWPILFGGKFISALFGKYYDSPASHKDIAKLTAIPGCSPDEAELPVEKYSSFNDFFARRLKPGSRPADMAEQVLISPADGRLSVHTSLLPTEPVPVKGAMRTINELCGSTLPDVPVTVAVVRLAPVDYHRYHFPCDCTMTGNVQVIPGKYHSVNPVALLRYPEVFAENTRHITRLYSPKCGNFLMIEVAAFGVGSIIQCAGAGEYSKMDEKGYFKFGGSTVIMVFEHAKVSFDDDVLNASANNMELLVRCGERIAEFV